MFKLHHVGIVVNNIEEAARLYSNMFDMTSVQSWGVKEVPDSGLKFITLFRDNLRIELIEPIRANSRFDRFLKERGEGLFHINIFTDDFDAEVKALKEKGFVVEVEEKTATFPGYMLREAWLRPEDTRGVWIVLADARGIPESRGGLAP